MRATHGVLVTYRRTGLLADHLRRLAAQTAPLAGLVVIDNGGDDAVRELVAGPLGQAAARSPARYVSAPHNPGPAGGFSIGIANVLAGDVGEDDMVVLLDDNDPPWRDDTFERLLTVFEEIRLDHPEAAGVGVFGARLGSRGRLRVATGDAPVTVDYLSGAGCPHYTIGALRRAPGPAPELFFGFEELDLGLTLGRSGHSLWSSGLAREHGCEAYVVPSRAALAVDEPSWRRYYSVRNLITVLRRNGRRGDALFVSVVAGLGKPLANLAVRPRAAWANLRLTAPAVADAWRGRLGRRVEPA